MAKRKKRKSRFQKLLFSIKDRNRFLLFFRLYAKINKSWKICVVDRENFFQVIDKQGNALAVLHKGRIPLYKSGIPPRVFSLLDDYMIDSKTIEDGDVFIDCGANIGELGVALRLSGKSVRYVAFEPGPAEHEMCVLNNPGAVCEKQALWSSSGELKFYEKSDSADSSLIEFGEHSAISTVVATTLDHYCQSNGIDEIKYLKLEAEGAEPEALEGARNTLRKTHFVTVDCGFERGVSKESTLPQVCNYLIQNGFQLRELKEGRLIALFENVIMRGAG